MNHWFGLLLVALVMSATPATATVAATPVSAAAAFPKNSPEETMRLILQAAGDEKSAKKRASKLITGESREILEEYHELRERTNATNVHPDPLGLFLQQMRELTPAIEESRDFRENIKLLKVVYKDGRAAVFMFRREGRRWKLDLAEELKPAIEIFESVATRTKALKEAIETGKPLPEGLFEDEDD